MPIDSTSLPDDVALLKRMVVTAGIEIEKLKAQIARLRRMQFGRSSEKLDTTIAQLELLLDDIEEERGESEEQHQGSAPDAVTPSRSAGLCRTICRAKRSCTALRSRTAVARDAAVQCAGSAKT